MNFYRYIGVKTLVLNKYYDIDNNYVYDYIRGHVISRHTQRPILARGSRGYVQYPNAIYNRRWTYAHRILYCKYHDIEYTTLPKDLQIDHVNNKKLDNRIINLRLVNNRMNHQNKTKYKNNSSGYKGVYFDKQKQKWKSFIGYNNRLVYLGLYNSSEDARMAYNRKAAEINERENACYRLS